MCSNYPYLNVCCIVLEKIMFLFGYKSLKVKISWIKYKDLMYL
jgi:hypothetical protein